MDHSAGFPRGVHFVTDRRRCVSDAVEYVVERAVAGGVAAVHVREPDLPAGELFALAVRLREVTAGRCALVVNDRLDVALAVGADAVQLGGQGLPVAAARKVVDARGPGAMPEARRLLIGRSVHSVAEAVEAERQGADYVLVGTIYASASHSDIPPAGLGLIEEVRKSVSIPLVGIGGITAANAREVFEAGADGVAVIGALLQAADVEAAARSLVQVVHEATDEIRSCRVRPLRHFGG